MIQLKKASPKYFNSIEAWTIYNYVGRSKISASDLNKKYPTIIKDDNYIYLYEEEDFQNFITSDSKTFVTTTGNLTVIKGGI